MTNLIPGGAGRTGHRVISRLLSRSLPVHAASRRSGFDWDDDSTWINALRGASAAYVCFSPDLAFPGVPEKMDRLGVLAARAGLQRFVLLSGRGEEGARKSEQALRDSGIPTTVVRCSWFQQNFSEHFLLGPVRRGILRLPATDVAEAFVDLDGRNASTSDGVQVAIGRMPADFRAYAERTAATGVWS